MGVSAPSALRDHSSHDSPREHRPVRLSDRIPGQDPSGLPPDYFAKHGKPNTPQDLAHHACINMRFATLGNVYAWEFEKGSREVNVKVEGQLTVNDIAVIREAALNGVGIGFMPEDIAQPHVGAGRLVRVLADWTPPFPGYYLYYPSRRQQSPAFSLLVEALRYRTH